MGPRGVPHADRNTPLRNAAPARLKTTGWTWPREPRRAAMHILNIRSAEPWISSTGSMPGRIASLNDGDRLALVPAAEAANS